MPALSPSASSVKIHFHISDFDTYYRLYYLKICHKIFCQCFIQIFTLISANHTYDGLIKSQQKPVHHVKHTVHGSHLTQDSIKKKIVALIPTQNVILIFFLNIFLFYFVTLTHCKIVDTEPRHIMTKSIKQVFLVV